MQNKITKSITAGIIGTAVMTLFMMIAPMMGMPKMSAPHLLFGMLGVPIAVGWIMHFMIGTIFAFAYAFFFINVMKKVSSNILKGAIFGFAVFIFAQIMMAFMGMMMPIPPMEGNMMLIIIGSIMGHIVFGITVAIFIKEQVAEKSFA